jgi:hypothetical protein
MAEETSGGNIFPIEASQVRQALDAENAEWISLNQLMMQALADGKVHADFTNVFTNDLAAWQIFFKTTTDDTPIFTGETMIQLDAHRQKRASWAKQLEAKTGTPLPGDLTQAPARPEQSFFGGIDTTVLLVLLAVYLFSKKGN